MGKTVSFLERKSGALKLEASFPTNLVHNTCSPTQSSCRNSQGVHKNVKLWSQQLNTEGKVEL